MTAKTENSTSRVFPFLFLVFFLASVTLATVLSA